MTKRISLADRGMLALLARRGVGLNEAPISTAEIGAEIGIDPATVWRSLTRLDAAGAIRFSPSRGGQGSRVALTDQGQQIAA